MPVTDVSVGGALVVGSSVTLSSVSLCSRRELLVQLPVNGHLSCFQFETMIDEVTADIHAGVSLWICIVIFLGPCLAVELLGDWFRECFDLIGSCFPKWCNVLLSHSSSECLVALCPC